MFRSRTFVIIFGSSMLLNIAQGVGQALGLHMAIFFWHLTSAQIPLIGVGAVAGLMLGAPLAARLAKYFEKRSLLVIGMGGLAACQALPVPLKMAGLSPTGDGLLYLLIIFAILNGAMFTVSAVGFMTVIPDAADEHEDLFGSRREGMYFAGWAFASKASHGAGLLISGIALQLIDFPANISEHSAAASAAISAAKATWLGLAGGPLPGLIALVGTSIALLYRVDRQEHARILDRLAARHAPAA